MRLLAGSIVLMVCGCPASAQNFFDEVWVLNLMARLRAIDVVPVGTTLSYQQSQTWTSAMAVPADVRAGLRVEWGGAFPDLAWKPDHIAYGGAFTVMVPTASTFPGGVAAVTGQAVGGSAFTGLNGGLFTANAGSNAGWIFGGNSVAATCLPTAAYDPTGATCYTGHNYVVGWEADTVCHDPTTQVCASFMAATSGTQKGVVDAGFYVSPITKTAVRRGHGLYIGDNAVEAAFLIGTGTNAPSQNSAPGYWKARGGGGTVMYGIMNQLFDGSFRLAVPASGRFQVQDQGSSAIASIQPNAVTLSTGCIVTSGSGTPEGVVTAPVCSLFMRTDGGATTTLYVKTSGSGNTGWTAK